MAAPGLDVTDAEDAQQAAEAKQLDERQKWMLGFWMDLVNILKLDDKEQPPAKPKAESNIFFSLPTQGNLWITCYFNSAKIEAGAFLGYNRTAQSAVEVINRIELNATR